MQNYGGATLIDTLVAGKDLAAKAETMSSPAAQSSARMKQIVERGKP